MGTSVGTSVGRSLGGSTCCCLHWTTHPARLWKVNGFPVSSRRHWLDTFLDNIQTSQTALLHSTQLVLDSSRNRLFKLQSIHFDMSASTPRKHVLLPSSNPCTNRGIVRLIIQLINWPAQQLSCQRLKRSYTTWGSSMQCSTNNHA